MIKNKALVFDLGDVIIDLKPEIQWWNEDLLPNFHHDKLIETFQQKFFHDFEKGIVSVDDFLQKMNSIKINETKSVDEVWCAILKHIPPHRIELLRKLSLDNRLFLLSNTNYIHINHIFNDIIKSYQYNIFDSIFETQFYSQEIGKRKPDAETYIWVQDRIQTQPTDIYFFDDKIENLEVPKQLGWNTFLVNQDIATIIEMVT